MKEHPNAHHHRRVPARPAQIGRHHRDPRRSRRFQSQPPGPGRGGRGHPLRRHHQRAQRGLRRGRLRPLPGSLGTADHLRRRRAQRPQRNRRRRRRTRAGGLHRWCTAPVRHGGPLRAAPQHGRRQLQQHAGQHRPVHRGRRAHHPDERRRGDRPRAAHLPPGEASRAHPGALGRLAPDHRRPGHPLRHRAARQRPGTARVRRRTDPGDVPRGPAPRHPGRPGRGPPRLRARPAGHRGKDPHAVRPPQLGPRRAG